jgi:hypothetical protein
VGQFLCRFSIFSALFALDSGDERRHVDTKLARLSPEISSVPYFYIVVPGKLSLAAGEHARKNSEQLGPPARTGGLYVPLSCNPKLLGHLFGRALVCGVWYLISTKSGRPSRIASTSKPRSLVLPLEKRVSAMSGIRMPGVRCSEPFSS